jgi:hypothetical protein
MRISGNQERICAWRPAIALSAFLIMFVVGFCRPAFANPTVDPLPLAYNLRNVYVFFMILLAESGIICLIGKTPVKKTAIFVAIANTLSSFIGFIIRHSIYLFDDKGGLSAYLLVILIYVPVAMISEWPFCFALLLSESHLKPLRTSIIATIYAQIASNILEMFFVPHWGFKRKEVFFKNE